MSGDVVITGLGIISPIGIGVDAMWESLSTRKTGISHVTLYSGLASPDNVGGECRDFNDESVKKIYLKDLRKSIKVMCREIQMGVAAALLALKDCALNLDEMDRERLGVEYGANLMLSAPDVLFPGAQGAQDPESQNFELRRWGKDGMPKLEPLWLLKFLPNMPACHIGIVADARGPNNSLTLDEASGNTVLAEACRIMQRGAADAMIAGCTGTTLHPIKTLHLALQPDMATTPADPALRARPFEKNRTGRVVAEGACTLMLETAAAAHKRGARIYGSILGTGSAIVADRQGQPDFRRALVGAMRSALRSAQLQPAEIGHINAHGLGTREMDRAEAAAIHEVFGELGRTIPVTAPKSFIGNSGAAAGLLELAASLISLQHGVIPPTLNYDVADPECGLNVVSQAQPATNKKFLNLSVTRIGQASASIIEAT